LAGASFALRYSATLNRRPPRSLSDHDSCTATRTRPQHALVTMLAATHFHSRAARGLGCVNNRSYPAYPATHKSPCATDLARLGQQAAGRGKAGEVVHWYPQSQAKGSRVERGGCASRPPRAGARSGDQRDLCWPTCLPQSHRTCRIRWTSDESRRDSKPRRTKHCNLTPPSRRGASLRSAFCATMSLAGTHW
jgi:hypothetical protein